MRYFCSYSPGIAISELALHAIVIFSTIFPGVVGLCSGGPPSIPADPAVAGGRRPQWGAQRALEGAPSEEEKEEN